MNLLHRFTPLWIALACALLVSACSGLPDKSTAPPDAAIEPPPAWLAPLPHEASSGTLQAWWGNLGDPLLTDLIEQAQKVSPTIASAASRVAQSRSTLTLAKASEQPSLDANLSAQRGVNGNFPTTGTALQASLDASWEIDLFGANRATESAAQARLQGTQADWHAARVSVAAEVASQYFGWQTCRQVLNLMNQNVDSLTQSARLTQLTADAGLAAPTSAALANAARADAHSRAAQQENQCESQIKALVELTALPEATLRERLLNAPTTTALHSLPAVSSVPAQVMAQRPDLYSAQREVAAASAEIGASEARRYPSLKLAGSVGALNYTNAQGSTDLSTWSIGPVALDIPLWDGARRAANVDAAKARYTEAVALYRAKARQVAREVENALLALAASESRLQQAQAAQSGYQFVFEADKHRLEVGNASQTDLENSRRTLLSAQINALQTQLERSNAWITLYRSLGGGWDAFETSQAAENSDSSEKQASRDTQTKSAP